MLASRRRKPAQAIRDEYDEALAALGLRDEQADEMMAADQAATPDEVELWPEHLDAVNLFDAMRTQWRMGARGAIGLDYAVLPMVERDLGLRRRGWRQRRADMRVIEDEALQILDERNAAAAARAEG